jgi:hypothetical protein
LIIGLTGFLEVERIWIGRIVNCLGGVCTDTFSRKNTHLLAQDVLAKSAKISKAKEWKCPIIRVDWLYSVLEHGVLPGSSKRVPLQDRISQDDSMVPSLKAGKGEDVFDTISTKVADPYLDPLEQLLFDEVKPVVMPVPEMKPKVMDISEFIPQAEPKKRTIQVEVEKSKSVNTLQQSVSYDDHDSVSQQNRLFQPNTKKPKVIERVFMFSGLSPIDRQTVAREVPNLGGSCLNQDKWDPKCTHLIVLEPQKTEKFLAACASGAWYL